MSLQQVAQPRSSANGFSRRRGEKEMGNRVENKSQAGKSNFNKLATSLPMGNKGGVESPSRERLVYLTTCLIGHQVEVQVVDGSVFSGIFHATNAEKDFGIILKMARLTKTGSSRGHKSIPDSVNKPPSKTLIIPAKDLVQIIAKSVSVTRDGLTSELQHEKQVDILIDSSISQSRHVELERELEPWVPDEDNPECPELDNTFDRHWNRGWDQFEANATLFGVKSTFNEELYTTKLDRGPQMRDLEKEAARIAREIEGEDTQDLHLAEERGIHFHDSFDLDEETKYSSVYRGVDDSGFDEDEDILDSHNIETFGDVTDSAMKKSFNDLASGKTHDGSQVSSSFSSLGEVQSSQLSSSRDFYASGSLDGESRAQETQMNQQHDANNYNKEDTDKHMLSEQSQSSKTEDAESYLRSKKESSDKGLSANATAYAPSNVSSKSVEKTSASDVSEDSTSVKVHGATASAISRARPGSSASSTSECGNAASAASGPGLSPSSSLGSLTSEKSTLNPHAKEFRLNPNAKSFVPSQTPLRPASPVSDSSFYYPAAPVPHMHSMPVAIGMGPSFAPHQPVMFGPQATSLQSPQAYFHPNGPQYGQQMLLGQPRQVVYMPTYPPDMQYKGRDY